MDKIRITGGNELRGIIPISGAKNAALPLMIASLLTDETLILDNVPRLADVNQLLRILNTLGVDYTIKGRRRDQSNLHGQTIHLCAKDIIDTTAPYELVAKMRASFWVIGALLTRAGEAKISLPGGCAIGTRPVDFFIMGLKAMGAEVDINQGYIEAKAPNGLTGNTICFPKISVGATHTLMMAATLAKGQTVLENAAQEPEVVDLANCLIAMGAQIKGAGTSIITIDGVDKLHSARHSVLADRIEAGTYAMAVAATGGDLLLEGARYDLLETVFQTLEKTGVKISNTNDGIRIARDSVELQATDISTSPYPGFPTDLQAQFMALMTTANGTSQIDENIFENRFMHVQEMARLGAMISLDGHQATVTGVKALHGAPVMATDLRASVSLVITGLMAEGETVINRIYHLDRGFEKLEEKLSACGANIERLSA